MLKRAFLPALLLPSFWLTGCGGNAGGGGGLAGPALVNPGTGGSAGGGTQFLVPPGLTDVLLRVRIDFDQVVTGSLEQDFSDQVARFRLEVFDAESGQALAAPVVFDRLPGNLQEQTVPNLSGRFLRVVLTSLDEFDGFLGVSESTVAVLKSELLVTFGSGLFAGPTREVGRISAPSGNLNTSIPLSDGAVRSIVSGLADGASNDPALSSDGRFVVFSSTSRNLLPVLKETARRDIFLRDRSTGVTTMISDTGSALNTVVDGTSNTLLISEQLESSHPDISGDGQLIVFERGGKIVLANRTQGKLLQTLSEVKVAVGVGTRSIRSATQPCISENGRFVAYTALLDGESPQIAVLDRVSGATVVVSKSPGGALANGECAHPVLSADGLQVFFSTTATNLAGSGLVVHNLATSNTSTLAPPSATRCGVSRNGRLVAANVDNRLLLIDRDTNTTTEVLAPATFTVQGAPSLSGDGRFLTFASPLSDLVSNDRNNRADVFVLDRTLGTVSRVNLSGDGVAADGGVDLVLSRGPVISRDGTRVAFASEDNLLVPNDSQGFDVFSSANPSAGRLYVARAGTIQRFDGVVTAAGAVAPSAVMTNPGLTGQTTDLFLDTANDRLYALTGMPASPRIAVFDQISSRTSGPIPARIRAQTGVTGRGLFVDVGRDELYLGNTVVAGASQAGAGARRNLGFVPNQIFVDTRALLAYGTVGDQLQTTPGGVAGTASLGFSIRPGLRCIQPDISQPTGLLQGRVSNMLGLFEGTPFHRLAGGVLTQSGGAGISGAATLLGQTPTNAPGRLLVDAFSGAAYLSNTSDTRIVVFQRPTVDSGDVPPNRVLNLGFVPEGMALDRTR